MDQEDLILEERVWNRVGAAPETGMHHRPELQELLLREEENAAVFRSLARIASAARREQLTSLAHHAHINAEALRGMLHLDGCSCAAAKNYLPKPDAGTLARAYRSLCRGYEDYVNLSDHGSYAPVFRCMAEDCRKDLKAVLQLLGS